MTPALVKIPSISLKMSAGLPATRDDFIEAIVLIIFGGYFILGLPNNQILT